MSALRRIRVDKRMSIAELATKAELSEDTIRDLERGSNSDPRISTLTKLADALGVQPSAIDPVLNPVESPERAA